MKPIYQVLASLALFFAFSSCATRLMAPVQPYKPPSEVIERPERIVRGNTQIRSFSTAKRLLLKIYKSSPVTLYCGCRFDNEKRVDHNSCGYNVRKNRSRANRVEWEHVMPASWCGQQMKAWTKGHPDCVTSKGKAYKGRKCARKVNQQYRLMESDMYNLFPSVGEVNGDRSNYPIGLIAGEERHYGACDVEVRNKVVEPRPTIRGDIARAMLYMNSAYPSFSLVSSQAKSMFLEWSKIDPPDLWECERSREIEVVQGNINPFVSDGCY